MGGGEMRGKTIIEFWKSKSTDQEEYLMLKENVDGNEY